jgi:hypothetical protein
MDVQLIGEAMSSVEIAVDIKVKTPKAVLVSDGKTEVWIPLSQITDYTDEIEVGKSITIFISEWLATEKGLL